MFRTRCQLEMLAGSPLQLCSARRRRVVWGEVFVGCLQYSLLQLCSVHCLCIAHWRRRQYVQVSFFHLIREDCMCIVGPGCQDNFAQREKTVGFAIKLPTRIIIQVVPLKGDEFWVWVHLGLFHRRGCWSCWLPGFVRFLRRRVAEWTSVGCVHLGGGVWRPQSGRSGRRVRSSL